MNDSSKDSTSRKNSSSDIYFRCEIYGYDLTDNGKVPAILTYPDQKDSFIYYKIKITNDIFPAYEITKRYSEFVTLHEQLARNHPSLKLPSLPGWPLSPIILEKYFFGNLDENRLRKRQHQLEVYLNALLKFLNPKPIREIVKFIKLKEKK